MIATLMAATLLIIISLLPLFNKQLPDCLYRLVHGKESSPDINSKKRGKDIDDKEGRKNNDTNDDTDTINDQKLKDKNRPSIRRVSYSDIINEEIDSKFNTNDALNDGMINEIASVKNEKHLKGNQNRSDNKR